MTYIDHPVSHVTVLLPPGWVRLSLTADVAVQAEALTDDYLASVPRDQRAHHRRLFVDQLASVAREAAAGGASDLFLPGPALRGAFRSTFVMAPLPIPEGVDAVEMLAAIAANDPSAKLLDLPGLVAMRIEGVAARGGIEQGQALARQVGIDDPLAGVTESRRVQYFIGDPDRPDDWVRALFSTPLADDEDGLRRADAEAELFDAIISSVRFV